MKIVNVVGARPQFDKCAPVSWAIEEIKNVSTSPIERILIHAGQYYDYAMSEIFFKELTIPEPDYHLRVGSGPMGCRQV
jgi:UDP-N-acetylglucosamine 2-epimerase (non-hydrolysing)